MRLFLNAGRAALFITTVSAISGCMSDTPTASNAQGDMSSDKEAGFQKYRLKPPVEDPKPQDPPATSSPVPSPVASPESPKPPDLPPDPDQKPAKPGKPPRKSKDRQKEGRSSLKSWTLNQFRPNEKFRSGALISWEQILDTCRGKNILRVPVMAAMHFQDSMIQRKIDEADKNLPEQFKTHKTYFLYFTACFDPDGKERPFGAICTTDNNPERCTSDSAEKDPNWNSVVRLKLRESARTTDQDLSALDLNESIGQRFQEINPIAKMHYKFPAEYEKVHTAKQRLTLQGKFLVTGQEDSKGRFPLKFEGSLTVEGVGEKADVLQKRIGNHDARLLPSPDKAESGWLEEP